MNQVFIDQWRETAEAFDQRYQAIGDQGRAATPCDEWCVDGECGFDPRQVRLFGHTVDDIGFDHSLTSMVLPPASAGL